MCSSSWAYVRCQARHAGSRRCSCCPASLAKRRNKGGHIQAGDVRPASSLPTPSSSSATVQAGDIARPASSLPSLLSSAKVQQAVPAAAEGTLSIGLVESSAVAVGDASLPSSLSPDGSRPPRTTQEACRAAPSQVRVYPLIERNASLSSFPHPDGDGQHNLQSGAQSSQAPTSEEQQDSLQRPSSWQ